MYMDFAKWHQFAQKLIIECYIVLNNNFRKLQQFWQSVASLNQGKKCTRITSANWQWWIIFPVPEVNEAGQQADCPVLVRSIYWQGICELGTFTPFRTSTSDSGPFIMINLFHPAHLYFVLIPLLNSTPDHNELLWPDLFFYLLARKLIAVIHFVKRYNSIVRSISAFRCCTSSQRTWFSGNPCCCCCCCCQCFTANTICCAHLFTEIPPWPVPSPVIRTVWIILVAPPSLRPTSNWFHLFISTSNVHMAL